MKPHKHAELIKAWADGADIQIHRPHLDDWKDDLMPSWEVSFEYRIKPEPKPDVVYKFEVDKYKHFHQIDTVAGMANLKLTFDGETGELKSAEVLK